MTELREIIAFSLWRGEAVRAAPNVAKSRTIDAFREQSPTTIERWMASADDALAAIKEAGLVV